MKSMWLLVLLSMTGAAVAAPAPSLLKVSPTAECIIVGTEGGPFAPTGCTYSVSASRAWANFTVAGKPAWLTVSTASGRTPLTITYAVAANALPAGTYQATLTFQNLSAAQPPLTRSVRLTVNPRVVTPPPASWTMTLNSAPAHYTNVGDTLTFQYVLTNTGQTTVNAIQVTSTYGAVSCPFASLSAGQQMMCSHTYAVTQTDLQATSIVDTVVARSTEAPVLNQTLTVNYAPSSSLGYLMDAIGGRLCVDATCQNFLTAQ